MQTPINILTGLAILSLLSVGLWRVLRWRMEERDDHYRYESKRQIEIAKATGKEPKQ